MKLQTLLLRVAAIVPSLRSTFKCRSARVSSSESSNDPIFFLHHANIDRIWGKWQAFSEEHRAAYSGCNDIIDRWA